MQLTRHAALRRAQRNFPLDILQLIQAYGTPIHAHGALSLMMDDTAIDLAAEDDRRRRQSLRRYRGAYLIEGKNGAVVTVARGHRRFRR